MQWGLILLAYFLGSLNSAILICKLMGLPSPRSVGSGNPGATNVLRLGNKKAAGLTLAGDVLKGILPVLIGHALHFSNETLCWVAFAAILGHIFPIFFGFKGGKGVATAMGAFFAVNFLLGLATGATWLIIAGLFRMSSLASIIAILLTPAYAYFLLGEASVLPLSLIALLIVIRHRSNIARIMKAKESKIFGG
jgi:acyl phosphate:glycerol-3-phosphate acyltransferase